MKRVAIFLMMASLVSLAVTVSYAGDYHVGGKDPVTGEPFLKCAQCHTMHRSQQHAYTPASPGSPTDYSAVGPQPALLKDKVNELCLSCHNRTTASIVDVFSTTAQGPTYLRQAGGLNVLTGGSSRLTNETGYSEMTGHTLYSKVVAPGGTWANSSEGLNCVDCHMPHGHVKTQWRNLWTNPDNTADKFYNKPLTYSNDAAAPDKEKDIWEVGEEVYTEGDVWFNEVAQDKSPYADWCKSCHTNFHGAAGGTEVGGQGGGFTFSSPVDWVRHPNADVNIGHETGADYVSSLARYQSRTNKVKVMSRAATTVAQWGLGPADATPSCFTCHKGHGNKNPFGLILMAGTGARSEEGDADGLISMTFSRPAAPTPLCQQCHIQGVEAVPVP